MSRFKFSLQDVSQPGHSFQLTSQGKDILFSGLDKDGKPLRITFFVPKTDVFALRERLEPALALASESDYPTDYVEGWSWSLDYNLGGMRMSASGMITTDENKDAVIQEVKHVIGRLEAESPENAASFAQLRQRAPVLNSAE